MHPLEQSIDQAISAAFREPIDWDRIRSCVWDLERDATTPAQRQAARDVKHATEPNAIRRALEGARRAFFVGKPNDDGWLRK